jgi:hypothetical protein
VAGTQLFIQAWFTSEFTGGPWPRLGQGTSEDPLSKPLLKGVSGQRLEGSLAGEGRKARNQAILSRAFADPTF